jgi:hypothetical protein
MGLRHLYRCSQTDKGGFMSPAHAGLYFYIHITFDIHNLFANIYVQMPSGRPLVEMRGSTEKPSD